MPIQSHFESDLEKEQKLSVLLDTYYTEHLKNYEFERIHDLKRQIQGVDLVFTNTVSGKQFFVDEKAQLDYINEELPTFAFELNYHKKGRSKKGWLFDTAKKTGFYALVTAIYTDEPNIYTSCKITFVNRAKLISFLGSRNLDQKSLESIIEQHPRKHSKLKIDQLDSQKEGYLYFSRQNKAEKPINLILKLNFLIENGLAKRFV